MTLGSSLHQLERSAFVLQEAAFRQNLETIRGVAQAADVEIILALKAFSFWPAFSIAAEYLPGATASSLNEALLVRQHFGVKPHVYCPAYRPAEFERLLQVAGPLTFNTLSEYERYAERARAKGISCGLRINPMYSDVETALYNPANPQGRLGTPMDEVPEHLPAGLEGIHVHTLCESPAATTVELIDRLTSKLDVWLQHLKWLNLGGGHLMTRADYDRNELIAGLQRLRVRYPRLRVILEPGSAHAWQAGVLVAHVLDLPTHHERTTAMLDVSFTCHMPDVLEMPYMPRVRGARVAAEAENPQSQHVYALGGMSCLAGDAIAPYCFDEALEVGDTVVFEDMLHYTTVKTTTFNGVPHPDLVIERLDGTLELMRRFDYSDFESRLG